MSFSVEITAAQRLYISVAYILSVYSIDYRYFGFQEGECPTSIESNVPVLMLTA
jgi:hypothetical protein